MSQFDLGGKVAIVTGGAGGIGRAYGRGLAGAGASVVLADIDADGAARAASELEAAGFAAAGVAVDVTSPDSTRAMARAATERFGGVDILVNNAALMAEIPPHPLAEMPLELWDRVLRVNLTGYLLCAQAVVPLMKERGGGKIVNQLSGGAYRPSGLYGVSKYAAGHLTAGLAAELGPLGINVNAIAPGAVETEAGLRASPESSPFREMLRSIVPLRGFDSAPPEDLVGTLLLLVSPAGQWITGQVIGVDGGWIMRL